MIIHVLVCRVWGEELLADACQSLAEELAIPYDAPGGMPVYRLSLTFSFFYKFYLLVRSRLDSTLLPASCHTAVEVICTLSMCSGVVSELL